MRSSLPAATDAEIYRIDVIKRDIGCIACYKDGHPHTWADAHHLIDPLTGNRISHAATIPLCKAHHLNGPVSIHKNKRAFEREYGSDMHLLELTNSFFTIHRHNTIGGKYGKA